MFKYFHIIKVLMTHNLNKIILYLSIIILSLVTVLGVIDSSVITCIRQFLLTICFIFLTALLWKSKWTKLFSVIFILLWMVNVSISLMIYYLFESQLNYQLAINILSTNEKEALDFVLMNWNISLLVSSLFFLMCWSVNSTSKIIKNKYLVILSIILITIFSYKFLESAIFKKTRASFDIIEKILPYTSLNNFGVISHANKELKILKTIKNNSKLYKLSYHDTKIDTYVIVIGESARRDHFSLYGYSRDTTPTLDELKNELFIFDNAIAPSPTTLMALSSALTVKPSISNDTSLIGDNIINLANQAGYKTYWYSKQGTISVDDTPITAIASNADVKEWINVGLDDELLNSLSNALTDKNKKLIVLHTNGSHGDACNKYPAEDNFFKNGQSTYEDCYDNSILFTDKILGKIFNLLKDHNASVLYFSDHALLRKIIRGKVDYIHGAINPSKESLEVPQFIWYSKKTINSTKINHYSSLYPTADNYYLIANWLGISSIDNKKISSPLENDFKSGNEPILIQDTQLNIFNYENLRSDSRK